MTLTAGDVAALLALERTTPAPDDDTWSALTTMPALLAFVASTCRAEGYADESDGVELICRAANCRPGELRRYSRELRRLGYRAVADRLAQIAGRRKHGLKPLHVT